MTDQKPKTLKVRMRGPHRGGKDGDRGVARRLGMQVVIDDDMHNMTVTRRPRNAWRCGISIICTATRPAGREYGDPDV
jgi:hypothetical protein